MVNGVTRLIIAVRLMESATSPFAKFVNTFEVVPPGANEMIIKPTASSGGSLKASAIIKATSGKIMSCADIPIRTALGSLKTRVKSAMCKESPIPNIIINSSRGIKNVIRTSTWIGNPLREPPTPFKLRE